MEPQKSAIKFDIHHIKRKTIIILLPVVFAVFASVILVLSNLGVINSPIQNVSLFQSGPKVSMKEEYKNPFAKETQYVNPFEEYKNPFVVAK